MPPTLPTMTTERLVLRPWRDNDLDDLVARRNDDVGGTGFQNWTLPYTDEDGGVFLDTRIDGAGDPGVLERLGFRYEGRTRLSFWVGDDNSDDLQYGLTRDDWTAWTTRPTTAPDEV